MRSMRSAKREVFCWLREPFSSAMLGRSTTIKGWSVGHTDWHGSSPCVFYGLFS